MFFSREKLAYCIVKTTLLFTYRNHLIIVAHQDVVFDLLPNQLKEACNEFMKGGTRAELST